MAESKARKAMMQRSGKGATTAKPTMTLQTIENMFIEKFSEKYRLTERYVILPLWLMTIQIATIVSSF